MSSHTELLTPAEAAVVAGVTVRDINRVIDEHIVPESLYSLEGGRWLDRSACTYVRFYFHAAKRLTADERTRVIRVLSAKTPRQWKVRHEFLTIDLDGFNAETEARHAELKRARDLVVEDPEILGGTPVIRGTRIPVHDVARSVIVGVGLERLKAAYPGLDDDQIELASIYAEANPVRGRPRERMGSSPGLKLISTRTVARRPRP